MTRLSQSRGEDFIYTVMASQTLPYHNIDIVDDRNLCTECGACFGVCPKTNISINENENGILRFRVKDPSRCGNCRICIQVCPGMTVDFKQLHQDVFQTENCFVHANDDIGHYQDLYFGHAVNDHVRQGGASGGVTTALLAKVLADDDLDGVFVAKMKQNEEGSPLSTRVYLARNKEELLQGQQSKYATVPMATCLHHIIYEGKGKRFAFVGLGCHMQALRKAERIIPKLKRRIVLRLGLVCGHCMDKRGTRHLFNLLNVKEKNVQKIEYRSDRWPGNFKVTLSNGKTETIGQIDWTSYVMTLYEKHRCHFCTDPLNQLSDISTGDPWLNELAHEPGLNLVITRTKRGEQFFSSAVAEGTIAATRTQKDKIIRSQRRSLYRKRYMIRAYMNITKRLGRHVPAYTGQFDARPMTWREYREAIVLMFFRMLSAQPVFQTIITQSGRLFIKYMQKRRKKVGRMVLK